MANPEITKRLLKLWQHPDADAALVGQAGPAIKRSVATATGAGAVGTGIGAWGLHSVFGTSNDDVKAAKEAGVEAGKIKGVGEYKAKEAELEAERQKGARSELIKSNDRGDLDLKISPSTIAGAGGLAAGIGAGLLAKRYIDKKKAEKQK